MVYDTRVLHVFGTLNRGGAEMRTVELMPLMKEKGYQFDFCTVNNTNEIGALYDDVVNANSKVYSCPIKPNIISFCFNLYKIIKKHNYSIVHSHVHYTSGLVVFLARLSGAKTRIVHFRNTHDGSSGSIIRKIYRKISLFLAKHYATDILGVCQGALESALGSKWKEYKGARVQYNGLDLSKYNFSGNERDMLVSELSLSARSKIVIHVGRFTKAKAHDVLIDAARIFIKNDSDIHLLLVGIGNLQNGIKEKVIEYGLEDNIHFLGLRKDVPSLLKASDCMILSSRWEGLPGVVLEAIAANLPVIATNLPGVREIKQHVDNIALVPVENPQAISNSIKEIFAKYDNLNLKPYSFPKVFDLNECADRLSYIYGKLNGE